MDLAAVPLLWRGEAIGLGRSVTGQRPGLGGNSNGPVGDGTATLRPAPVAVSGVSGAGAIAAGEYDSFAEVGPSQILNLTVTGSGAGTVGGSKSILCPPACARRFTKATIKDPKKLAASFSSPPGAIIGYECKLIRPKSGHHKKRKPKGHKRALSRVGKTAKPRFAICGSPKTCKHLAVGRYIFQVRALDSLGADPKPATRKFKIKTPKPHMHKRGH